MVAPDLLLFDIDGTLLRARAAGRESLDEAFFRVCGWRGATEGVSLAGSTDSAICRAVGARHGCGWDGPDSAAPYDVAAVRAAYVQALEVRLSEPGRASACPGVHALLDRLAGRAHIALLTGNWLEGAARKLAAIGLAHDRFVIGAYGDDAVTRDGLVPVAEARARAAGLRWRRAIVIGDTPADVSCARAGGAVAVAVETGFATRSELERAAPDLLLPDLERGAEWLLALVSA